MSKAGSPQTVTRPLAATHGANLFSLMADQFTAAVIMGAALGTLAVTLPLADIFGCRRRLGCAGRLGARRLSGRS